MNDDLGNFSMLELFRLEVEGQTAILNDGLLALEQDATAADRLEALMRASHSVKGAARMVDVDQGVRLAHAMEDCFVAAQKGELVLGSGDIDILLRAVDLLSAIAANEYDEQELDALVDRIRAIGSGENKAPGATESAPPRAQETVPSDNEQAASPETAERPGPAPAGRAADADRAQPQGDTAAVRVSADNLNRLIGLAGEVQVESRWLRPFADALQQLKHRQVDLINKLDHLNDALLANGGDEFARSLAGDVQHKANQCRHVLADRLVELEEFDRRLQNLANRLNNEVIASRMRPFSDAVRGFPRMVRDLARELDKDVEFNIEGLHTRVDRDILDKIEAPLNHLLRNALDHGIESADERRAAGKPARARLRLAAVHSAGMLSITVEDDGRGIDPEALRAKVVEKNLVSEAMAAELSETELMEFLFLPGFSTRREVTELSGRGVGLDVVHSTVQQMRGVVRATGKPGQGMVFHMQLPLTLSVTRALMAEIGGEPYAFPLARIDCTLKLDRSNIESLEGRQYFTLGNQHVGLVFASQVLGSHHQPGEDDLLSIVVLGERLNRAGLVVDRFLGERDLVVHPLDRRLGKVKDISAASILENGDPCLIVDVDDMLRSIDILVAGGRLDRVQEALSQAHSSAAKRILVVDDSITVREVERNMLAAKGYQVEVAVDGMDGWNAVRTSDYDLVISDIDMPRMNGFEFVRLIKQDERLKKTPVMIVSYKDRDEDRQRGLEAGADYYLTKGSFHDQTLIEAVVDLIGRPE